MYILLSLVITAILGYFLPTWMYNLTWQEIIGVLNGSYDNDTISQWNIIKKVGIQQDYTSFFEEKLYVCIALTVAILLALLIITSIIKKCVEKHRWA